MVPTVIVALFFQGVMRRVVAGWAVGFLASLLGIYASFALDLPTGAAVVATFGVLLAIALVIRAIVPDRTMVGTSLESTHD